MNAPRMMLVPVAIRDGLEARLHFPADITPDEAAKIARVIVAYADEPKATKDKP